MIKSRTQKRVLVISTAAATVKGWLASAVGTNFIVEIHTATSGIEGFQKFTELRPDMVLVDDNLEDMNGMSFSAITKSTIQGDDVKILVYNVKQLLPYNKADEMLPAVNTQEELKSILSMVVKTFFEDLYIKTVYREEIEAKKIEQYNELPKPLSNNPYFDINYIFSRLKSCLAMVSTIGWVIQVHQDFMVSYSIVPGMGIRAMHWLDPSGVSCERA